MKTLIFISSLFLFSCATVDFVVEELPYEEIKEAQILIRTSQNFKNQLIKQLKK